MPENEVQSPPAASTDGKQSKEPVLTGDMKSRSDNRMASLVGTVAKKAPNYQQRFASEKGTPLPNSVAEKFAKGGGNGSGAAQPKPAETSQPPAQSQQAAQENKQESGKQEQAPKLEQKKDGSTDWEAESKKHQSRADKVQQEFETYKKDNEPRLKTLEGENKRLETLVGQFQKDPVEFINKYLPALAKQLAASGDPIKMVEYQVSQFKEKLDKEFQKEYGEDWKYKESEALKPGTPSFRYRMAIESRISEVRESESRKVQDTRQRMQDAEAQKGKDVNRLKEEFSLTDEDIKKGEEYLDKEKISYYHLLRLALFDTILKKQLDSIVPPPAAPKDITETRGNREVGADTGHQQVSPEMAKVLNRIGTRRFK